MKEKKGKRYLVTYTEPDIKSSKASSILGVSKSECKDGVAFMESDAVLSGKDILHFENVGISSLELSEEQHSELLKKKEVLAVEEDFDVHILELTQIEEQEEYINSTFALQKNGDETAFEEGYHNALLDMFSSMLHLGSRPVSMSNGNGHKSRLPPS